ncbi:MAG: T9SS type A sorting domain-containing protein, partial [FCB group bacterium]|nr:T9SS type A sorting domain-containing protein [FCB group bacterium]
FVMSVDEDYNFTEVFRDSLPFKDTRDFITAGDYDGDGVMEFAAGCHSSTDFVEFGYNLAYWLFYFYDYNITDTTFYRADSICIIGALDPFYYDSGISSGDADGDGKDEIMLCAAPNFYLIDWTETGGYQPNWQYPECFSNQALCFDIDGNGLAELTFNRGYGFASFEKLGGTNLPQAPMNFKVEPLGPDSVKLSWNKVTNVGFYDIRRGMTLTTLVSYSSTQSPSDTVYIDTNVITDSTYYYAVAVYYNFQYGPSSVTQSGIPNYPPELIDWQVFPPNNIRLFFSEPISSSASQTSNYSVNNGIGYPSSAVIESGMNRVLLCFTNAFEQSQYQITLGDIYDQQGSLINNSGPFTFQVMTPDETPYLVRAGLTGQGEVILEFSQQMTVESLEVVSNYSITYGNSGVIDILSASADTTDTKYVHLSTLSEKPMGALGFIYTVTANNIISVSGDTLDVNHNQVTMFFAGDNLKQAFVYPNPVKVEHPDYLVDGESCIVFANLTDNSVVRIYDSGGHHVVTLDEAVFSGGLKWDLVNKNGDRISSGIYIYYITDGVKSVTGKFAVMR